MIEIVFPFFWLAACLCTAALVIIALHLKRIREIMEEDRRK